jgi:hypothetical protein
MTEVTGAGVIKKGRRHEAGVAGADSFNRDDSWQKVTGRFLRWTSWIFPAEVLTTGCEPPTG